MAIRTGFPLSLWTAFSKPVDQFIQHCKLLLFRQAAPAYGLLYIDECEFIYDILYIRFFFATLCDAVYFMVSHAGLHTVLVTIYVTVIPIFPLSFLWEPSLL